MSEPEKRQYVVCHNFPLASKICFLMRLFIISHMLCNIDQNVMCSFNSEFKLRALSQFVVKQTISAQLGLLGVHISCTAG